MINDIDIIIACPNCNFLMKAGNIFYSGTSELEAVFRSKQEMYNVIDFEDSLLIVKCCDCGSLFWGNSAEVIGRIDVDRLIREIKSKKSDEIVKKWNALKQNLSNDIKQKMQAKNLRGWHEEFTWCFVQLENLIKDTSLYKEIRNHMEEIFILQDEINVIPSWEEQEEIKKQFPDSWVNAPSSMVLDLNDYLNALNNDKIINSDLQLKIYAQDMDLFDKEMYLRIRLWLHINDTIRSNEQEEIPETLVSINRENMGKLLQILSDKKPLHIIMKAEIYRRLGDFEKTINYISNMPIIEKYQSKAREIRNYAEMKNSNLF